MSRRLIVSLSNIFETRGGIPRFNQMLCLALDQLARSLDLEVTVLSQDDTDRHYEDAGRPWEHLRFLAGGGQLGLVRRTLGACARTRPDGMLVGMLGMTPLGALCRPWLRRGFGFVAHGTECWSEPRWTRRAAGRRAAVVLAVSRDTERRLVATTGIDAERVHWFPNTLSPAFGSPSSEPPPPAEHELSVLTVTRLWPEDHRKGVDHTLEAMARLVSRHPELRYCVVGKGADKPRLQELARARGIGDRVTFREDVPDEELARLYEQCAVFALPSGQEGFGIVFLEAMRFARPCIGGRAGGTPEVVADGETGLLVPFGDVDALERALDRLLSDASLRRSLGTAGRERLAEHFVFDRFRERLETRLEDWLGPASESTR